MFNTVSFLILISARSNFGTLSESDLLRNLAMIMSSHIQLQKLLVDLFSDGLMK